MSVYRDLGVSADTSQARAEDGRMTWRLGARHRWREDEQSADRASDEQIIVLLRACLPARDQAETMAQPARAQTRRR